MPPTRKLQGRNAQRAVTVAAAAQRPPMRGPMMDYKVLAQIGEGSSAHIFLVRKKNELFVLKQRKLAVSPVREQASLVLTEARILRDTSRHPCIVGFVEAFVSPSGGTLSIVCEYAAGGDLHSVLRGHCARGVKPGDAQVCAWLAQISLGLQALHRMFNIMHRDIKPANVLILRDGRVVLGDFGSSKVVCGNLASTLVGTPWYMSPELIAGEPYGYSSECALS